MKTKWSSWECDGEEIILIDGAGKIVERFDVGDMLYNHLDMELNKKLYERVNFLTERVCGLCNQNIPAKNTWRYVKNVLDIKYVKNLMDIEIQRI